VIQGGDGGMEYAMCTLILGEGTFEGLVGVIAHEMGHSWFQHILASNEGKHGWMDEGFTSYIEDLGMQNVGLRKDEALYSGGYNGYYSMVNSGKELPQGTHADRFDENRVYSISSYCKGELFLTQLEYLIGKDQVAATLKRFFDEFKFKHPTPNDIKRTAERVSGAELDWYLTDWTQTTNTIDYGIKEVKEQANQTTIALERVGRMPMPMEVLVEFTNGTQELYYIPLRMMHYVKAHNNSGLKRTVLTDWTWGNPNYAFTITAAKNTIKKITLDPSGLMADIKKENNVFENK
jgi:aminopeptidase N